MRRQVFQEELAVALVIGRLMEDRGAIVPPGQELVAAVIDQLAGEAWPDRIRKLRTVPYFPIFPDFRNRGLAVGGVDEP